MAAGTRLVRKEVPAPPHFGQVLRRRRRNGMKSSAVSSVPPRNPFRRTALPSVASATMPPIHGIDRIKRWCQLAAGILSELSESSAMPQIVSKRRRKRWPATRDFFDAPPADSSLTARARPRYSWRRFHPARSRTASYRIQQMTSVTPIARRRPPHRRARRADGGRGPARGAAPRQRLLLQSRPPALHDRRDADTAGSRCAANGCSSISRCRAISATPSQA